VISAVWDVRESMLVVEDADTVANYYGAAGVGMTAALAGATVTASTLETAWFT